MGLNRRALVGGGLTLAAAPAWAAEDGRIVNFQFANNVASLRIFLERKGPVVFAIDSGATSFAVANTIAQKFGLVREGNGFASGVLGSQTIPFYRVDEMIIGETLIMRGQYLAGLPMSNRPGAPQGLLPPLSIGQCLMNFETKTIQVFNRPASPPKDLQMLQADVPLAHDVTGGADERKPRRLVVKANFDGDPVKLMVDTGAGASVFLYPDYVKKQDLWNHYGAGDQGSYDGVMGGSNSREIQAERLEIGPFKFDKPTVTLADPGDSNRDGIQTHQGIIGMELLRRFHVWLDGRTYRVGLQPNAYFNDLPRRNRSGMLVDYRGPTDNSPYVTALRQGGPGAKAGLKPGDKILAFSGGGGLEELRWILSGPPGFTVQIKVARPDGDIVLKVVLEDPPARRP